MEKKKKGEKVCEIFKIEKKGKEKKIKTCGNEPEEYAPKDDVQKKENKMLAMVLLF